MNTSSLALITEVSRLQMLHPDRYSFGAIAGSKGMVLVNKENLVELYERGNGIQGGKGKGGIIAAEMAYWSGEACPKLACPKCCIPDGPPSTSEKGGFMASKESAWLKQIRGGPWVAANRTQQRNNRASKKPRPGVQQGH